MSYCMEQICRVCLSTQEEMVLLFYETTVDAVKDMFNKLTGTQAFPGDGLPELLCSLCLEKLENSYIFQSQCIKSDTILRQHNAVVSVKSEEKYMPEDIEPVTDRCVYIPETAIDVVIKHEDFDNDVQNDCDDSTPEIDSMSTTEEFSKIITRSSKKDDKEKFRTVYFDKAMFSCTICNKKYRSLHSSKRHALLVHKGNSSIRKTTEPPSKRKRFMELGGRQICKPRNILNQHASMLHKKEDFKKTYLCSFCGKILSCQSALKVHTKSHTGEKKYKCSYCDKTFQAHFTKQVHERSHTNEMPYVCSFCGQKFKTSGSLGIHIRKHTGDRPYKCTVFDCDKAFIQSSELKMHVRSKHTGQRDFQCTHCDKNFITKQHLKQHFERNHLAKPTEKKFPCNLCSNTYYTKQAVTKHLKQVHKIIRRMLVASELNNSEALRSKNLITLEVSSTDKQL